MTDPRLCHPSNGYPRELWLERDVETDNARARAICSSCPGRVPCLQGAEERQEPWGVWGGKCFFPQDTRFTRGKKAK